MEIRKERYIKETQRHSENKPKDTLVFEFKS